MRYSACLSSRMCGADEQFTMLNVADGKDEQDVSEPFLELMGLGFAYDYAVGDGDVEIDDQPSVKPQVHIFYCVLGYQILTVCPEETFWIKLFRQFIEGLRECVYLFLSSTAFTEPSFM